MHDAAIYQVNLRQFTPEGTLRAFAAHLPRLKALGVRLLWLMPVQPIGEQGRKGRLGSPYAISDHLAVHPDLGTLDDFRQVVAQARAQGMEVILDWVANHTAWDHVWVREHPDWYQRDAQGRLFAYTYTAEAEPEYWTDVIGLDWREPALWDGMIEAMAFWLRETGIAGFRCDVASLLPVAFWERARAELETIRPLFMLAESADPALHVRAFDMTYHWELARALRDIAQGRAGVPALRRLIDAPERVYPPGAIRMCFTSNHDVNAWTGSDPELYGPAFCAMAVIAFTWPGMPLILGGQEAALDRRLPFFERAPIDWKDLPRSGFYRSLLDLKTHHPALHHGLNGAEPEFLDSGSEQLLAFRRTRDDDSLTVVVNLGAQARHWNPPDPAPVRRLGPWGWLITDAAGGVLSAGEAPTSGF